VGKEDLDNTELKYKAGVINHEVMLPAKIKWLNARIALAEDRQNHLEVLDCLKSVKDTQESLLRLTRIRFEAGLIQESELIPIKEDILQTELRMKEARSKADSSK
jgi:hypothetical protein